MTTINPKFHIDKDGNATFGNQIIGKLIAPEGPRLIPNDKPLGGDMVVPASGSLLNKENESYVIGGKAKEMNFKLNNIDRKLSKLNETVNRQWQIWTNNQSQTDEHTSQNHMAIVETNELLDDTRVCLSDVCSKLHEMNDRIKQLEAAKLDKPSFSPELLDAERYMDDFEEVRKKYRVQRFAQKQRTRRKLERIKTANNICKRRKDNTTTLIAAISVAINVALFTYTVFF